MNIPSRAEAENLLNEAATMFPGEWVAHNRVAGKCAEAIAEKCGDIDPEAAYVLGLLHDIGRRFGSSDLRHVINGYKFMQEQGYTDSARICLTHSFPLKDMASYNGHNDCDSDETIFIQSYISKTQYDDYDRLIQLCDAISYPAGPCHLEKRFVDVVMRKGFSELTIPKWQEFYKIKKYFEEKLQLKVEDLFR